MWILGISKSHNGAVALIHNGKIVSAVQAERLSRIKRQSIKINDDKILLSKCVEYCLQEGGIKHSELNSIAISTPWDVEILNDKFLFNCIGGSPKNYKGTFYVPHHYAHVEYILHYSNLESGIVLVVDGSGSKEIDRDKCNIVESINSNSVLHTHKKGKETISKN